MPIKDAAKDDQYSTDTMTAKFNEVKNLDMNEFGALNLKVKDGSASEQEKARF